MALDRGYFRNQAIVDYLVGCGFEIFGTTQRVAAFPFFFGDAKAVAADSNHRKIEEEGALSIYWAHRKSRLNGKKIHALAYRMGVKRVATVITSRPDINLGKFVYVEKRPVRENQCLINAWSEEWKIWSEAW